MYVCACVKNKGGKGNTCPNAFARESGCMIGGGIYFIYHSSVLQVFDDFVISKSEYK